MTVLVGIVGETQKVAFAFTTLQDEEVRDGHLWSRKKQAGRRNNLSKSQREKRLIILLPKKVIPCAECGISEGTPGWEEREEQWKRWRGRGNLRQTRAVLCGTSWGTAWNAPLC